MKRNHFLQLIIVCLWLFCSFSVFAAPIDSQKAKDWVNDKGRVLLDTFNEPDLQKKYRQLDELFFKHVDLDYIGKFVVGKYWRQMSAEQQARYQKIFKRYAISVYKGFPLSFEQRISFAVTGAKSGDAYVDVTAAVDVGGKNEQEKPQVFLVTFRLAEKNSELRIIDLKLAESSLILSYRTRFYELFAADDGDVEWFLEDLENMTSSAEKVNNLRLREK